MSNTPALSLTPAAVALIKADVRAFSRDVKRYADYCREMNVTREAVAEHVAAFRDAYRTANPKADGDAVKAYATKVRNGLNRNVVGDDGDGGEAGEVVVNLLTRAGLKASLEDVIAAWEAAQSSN